MSIITILALLAVFVFASQGGYSHSFLFFVYIFAVSFHINVYRFYKMLYNNNYQINLL